MTPPLRRPGGRAFGPAVGARIGAIRRGRGLTLKRLARAAGISFPYLSNIETGRRGPSAAVLAAIAASLDLPVVDLLGPGFVCLHCGQPTPAGAPPVSLATRTASAIAAGGPGQGASAGPASTPNTGASSVTSAPHESVSR